MTGKDPLEDAWLPRFPWYYSAMPNFLKCASCSDPAPELDDGVARYLFKDQARCKSCFKELTTGEIPRLHLGGKKENGGRAGRDPSSADISFNG